MGARIDYFWVPFPDPKESNGVMCRCDCQTLMWRCDCQTARTDSTSCLAVPSPPIPPPGRAAWKYSYPENCTGGVGIPRSGKHTPHAHNFIEIRFQGNPAWRRIKWRWPCHPAHDDFQAAIFSNVEFSRIWWGEGL